MGGGNYKISYNLNSFSLDPFQSSPKKNLLHSKFLINSRPPTNPNKTSFSRREKSPMKLIILECEWLPSLFLPFCILWIFKPILPPTKTTAFSGDPNELLGRQCPRPYKVTKLWSQGIKCLWDLEYIFSGLYIKTQ